MILLGVNESLREVSDLMSEDGLAKDVPTALRDA